MPILLSYIGYPRFDYSYITFYGHIFFYLKHILMICLAQKYNPKFYIFSGPVIYEEDMSQTMEEVEASKRITRCKEFVIGTLTCETGYAYTAVMSNACVIFTSITVFYCIEMMQRDPAATQSNLENG